MSCLVLSRLALSCIQTQRLDETRQVIERQGMMTSSNGNIFRVTEPLCGDFTGHRWIPLTKASDAELWSFLWSVPWIKGWVNNHEAGDLRRHRAHYDAIVMARWDPDKKVSLGFDKCSIYLIQRCLFERHSMCLGIYVEVSGFIFTQE